MATRYKDFNHLLLIMINVGLAPFFFGFSNGYFNALNFDDVVRIYGIEEFPRATTQGWLSGMMSLTGGIGALCSAYFLKYYSRKQCLIFVDVLTIIISIGLQIPNIWVLAVCRGVQGVCIGMISSYSPLIMRELSPKEVAGVLAPINQISIVLGLSFSFLCVWVFSLFLPVQVYWRVLYFIPILTAGLQIYNLTKFFPYETPKYFIERDEIEKARQLISQLYNQEYVEEVLEEIVEGTIKIKEKQIEMKQLKKEPLKEKLVQKQQNNEMNKGKVKTYTKMAFYSSLLLSAQQQLVGTGAVNTYSGEMMLMVLPKWQKIFPVILHFTALTGVFGSLLMIKFFGRKGSLVYGGVALFICLIGLGYTLSILDLENPSFLVAFVPICLLLIRMSFSLTLGPVVWIYVSQVNPPFLIPYTTTINWLCVGFVITIFPPLKQWFGGNPAPIFIICGLYSGVSSLINNYLLIETTNKTEGQIQEQLKKKFQ